MWGIILVLSLFASAFAIIYAKDLNRRLLIQAHMFEKENIAANERWGKLLLEQSTLARQARIHELAQTRLGMITPDSNQIEIVKEAM
ncbi:MAG: cell division protein FtsL [Coxiella sp. RIFCSPHIGHO2_12_FULL_42_15]|nr:MAG: cell division protein FtsL [Coxiella sp. RIFCSPHIGHO2_12_FULL_42_15]